MKPVFLRIILILLFLLISGLSQAGAEQRTALVIGNGKYSSGPLRNPVNDAADVAAALEKAGFKVTLKKDAKLRDMEEAVESFGNRLKRGGVGLFYFAGHGVQVNGINYLIPVGARIVKESDVKYEAVDVNKILDEMANANNGLNIVMLDACRDNPYERGFRNATRGLAIVSNAPTGTFISYSTGPGQVAQDGKGRNSPYTAAFVQCMKQPGAPIEQVFKSIRARLGKETGGKQVPWELSSLQGEFYFIRGQSGRAAEPVMEEASAPAAESDKEQVKVDPEGGRLQKDKELIEQREAQVKQRRDLEAREKKPAAGAISPATSDELEAEIKGLYQAEREFDKQKAVLTPAAMQAKREEIEQRRSRVEEMKKQVAVGAPPAAPPGRAAGKGVILIDKGDGTVLDTRTGLLWAAKDNGVDITWSNAKGYCEMYTGGGARKWRMPTEMNLKSLYLSMKKDREEHNSTGGIHLTRDCVFVLDSGWNVFFKGVPAFHFEAGQVHRINQSTSGCRALPVSGPYVMKKKTKKAKVAN